MMRFLKHPRLLQMFKGQFVQNVLKMQNKYYVFTDYETVCKITNAAFLQVRRCQRTPGRALRVLERAVKKKKRSPSILLAARIFQVWSHRQLPTQSVHFTVWLGVGGRRARHAEERRVQVGVTFIRSSLSRMKTQHVKINHQAPAPAAFDARWFTENLCSSTCMFLTHARTQQIISIREF